MGSIISEEVKNGVETWIVFKICVDLEEFSYMCKTDI